MADKAPQTWPAMQKLWSRLDRIYLYCGYLAAFCVVCIFTVTMMQIVGRAIGYNPRGLTDYVGYFMAASAFLAMAHSLNKGAHVRIELFVSMMGRFHIVAEWFAFAVTSVIAIWLSYYSWTLVTWSYKLGDMSQGLDATPIWIPQSTMALGFSLMALSVVDHASRMILTGDHGIQSAPDTL